MSEGTRPGGLTALAVLNFLLAAKRVLDTGGLLFLMVIRDQVGRTEVRELAEALEKAGPLQLALLVVSSLLASILMVLAGVGYLQQRRVLGRLLGNLAALTTIGAVATQCVVMSETALGGSFGTIVALLYPVVTLFLLNVTFKEDFVR